jgi:aspartate racemase
MVTHDLPHAMLHQSRRRRVKKIGLLGGMTPEATRAYYDVLIGLGRERLDGVLSNPVVLIYSLNLAEVVRHQGAGRPDKVVELLVEVLESLRRAGAEIGALTANTPHIYLDQIAARTTLPLVSILDATSDRAAKLGCRKPLLLGTAITMTSDMYPKRLAAAGIEVVVPDEAEQPLIDRPIYDELSIGLVRDQTRNRLLEICRRHIERGADAIILGCTELPLILHDDDLPVPLIDTAEVHAEAIFEAAQA